MAVFVSSRKARRLEKKGAPVVVEGRRRVERDIRKGEI